MSAYFCDYKERTRSEPMRAVIKGFPAFNETALRSMKEDLGISMTLAELRYCQKAYSERNCGELTLDLLFFFDAIASGHHRSGNFAGIASFSMDDEAIAEIYRDLIEKRTLLQGSAPKDPPSLSELSEILSGVLERSGRRFDRGDCMLVADPYEGLSMAACGMIAEDALSLPDGLPSVRVFRTRKNTRDLGTATARVDDAIVLLHSDCLSEGLSSEELLNGSMVLRLSMLAGTEYYQSTVCAYRVIDTRGIAAALASLSEGSYTELSRIPSVFDDGELYDLALAEHGGILVSVAREEVTLFCETAKKYGISSLQIARAVRGKTMTVRKNGCAPFSIPTKLIRQIASTPVSISCAGGRGDGSVDASPVATALCRNALSYELAPTERSVASVQPLGNGFSTAAGASSLSFFAGVNAALLSVFEAALHGADLTRLSVYSAYPYPAEISARTMGTLLEAFLGGYRAFAELGIHSRASFLPRGNGMTPENGFAVYSYLPNAVPMKHQKHFSTEGASVYVTSLMTNENGLPNFDGVRSLLRYIAELARNGEILSARVALNKVPLHVVEDMCGDCEIAYNDPAFTDRLRVPVKGLFLVIESRSVLDGLHRLGAVKRTASVEAPVESMTDEDASGELYVPFSNKRIPSPRVLLIPSLECGNLYALEALFKAYGASVQIVPEITEDLDTDGVQIAVLCGRSNSGYADEIGRMVRNPRSVRALSSLPQNDGILLLPSDASDELCSLFRSDDGIPSMRQFFGSGTYSYSTLDAKIVSALLNYYR